MAASSERDPGGGPRGADASLVQGTIDRITFHAEESGYTVLRLVPEQGFGDPTAPESLLEPRVHLVGKARGLVQGLRVRAAGAWQEHPTHGRQLAFERLEVLPPLGREGLVRYLASPRFPGIGATLAERIVDVLGADALAKLREDPPELGRVPGLRAAAREQLVAAARAEGEAQERMAFLFGLGLSSAQATVVAEKLGADAEVLVRADPYRLATGFAGIGFRTADDVARRLGVPPDAPERRRAALVYALGDASGDGHTCLSAKALGLRAAALLGRDADESELAEDLAALEAERRVTLERELVPAADAAPPTVYLPYLHASEARLAENLAALHAAGPVRPLAGEAELARVAREAGIALHADQRAAVLGLLASPVALLTGGPGVGKTTIVQFVVALAERAGARVLLASPTGRAAKRLAEVTGREAKTVHRLLGWLPEKERFLHGPNSPLEADLVVVDEISMLDVVLAHHLVKAVQPPTRLLFVGDPDQLPAVGPGSVLADLLAVPALPAFRLTEIFRQAHESLIVTNAHRILAGAEPLLPDGADAGADFFLFPTADDKQAADRLVEVVSERIPRRFGLEWIEDVQVLAPMYRGACGVDELNVRLRAALGAGGHELIWGERVWRTGDRVIHTRNDYDREVFNGDMGRVVRIAGDGKSLTVRFPERELEYTRAHFADLQPAFAITVHRAQGCEFPAVVLPLVTSHALMLQRHLLYTAVTRARRLVVLVGQRDALRMAVRNAEQAQRTSLLAQRLRARGLA